MTITELVQRLTELEATYGGDMPVCAWLEGKGWWFHVEEITAPNGEDQVTPLIEFGKAYDTREL